MVDDYLPSEIAEHHFIGPFCIADILDAHTIWQIWDHPKPNKCRLIVDISHPADLSVNDGIPKELCSLSYITVDTATHHTMDLGRGALLAIMDIKSAFHLLSMHPSNCYLLAMVCNKGIYVDTILLFALRLAPKLFNIMIGLHLWILNQKGAFPTIHYLDDFLTMGQAKFSTCHDNLNIIIMCLSSLEFP